MTFEQTKEDYIKFRLMAWEVLKRALPHDPSAIHQERYMIEPWLFTAMEFAADLESFQLSRAAFEYEKPECKSWDYACALAHEEKRWAKKAAAAVAAIESRSIKLSQSLKLHEGR